MPLPFILGAAAAIAGAAGLGSGIHGAVKMKEANDTMKSADSRHKKNLAKLEAQSELTNGTMDDLGKYELEILKSFDIFSDVFERIQNKPQIKPQDLDKFNIPEYNGKTLREVSIGAGVLLGGLGGAAAGTAGGFAAAGATTAAVMALGTASTGTTIASLSGAAAVNATLAALGGGAIAAGGGGIALGTTILGAATAGIGLLVGGIIFNITGSSLSNKADEAYSQMLRAEKKINSICDYLRELSQTATQYKASLRTVNKIYHKHLHCLQNIVYVEHKTDWDTFTVDERLCAENTALLVCLLYNMCKVKLVLQSESGTEISVKSESETGMNTINHVGVKKSIEDAEQFILDKGLNTV